MENSTEASGSREDDQEETIILRPLNMEDMRQAKNQVRADQILQGSVHLGFFNDLIFYMPNLAGCCQFCR